MSANRRQFSRIRFETDARLFLPDGEHAVSVLDLSLKGALIRPSEPIYIDLGRRGTLKIKLDDMGAVIRLDCSVVHHQGDLYGLACSDIDLDSMTHLRRLVEVNLGDEALLQREFRLLLG